MKDVRSLIKSQNRRSCMGRLVHFVIPFEDGPFVRETFPSGILAQRFYEWVPSGEAVLESILFDRVVERTFEGRLFAALMIGKCFEWMLKQRRQVAIGLSLRSGALGLMAAHL